MKTIEIRKLSTTELSKHSTKLREEIFDLRHQLRLGQTTNVRQIRNKRKELARVLTILSEQLLKETN